MSALPGLREVIRRIGTLHGVSITSGLQGTPQTTAQGTASPGELVAIGTVHEYGSDDGHIPARPWLSTAAKRYRARWVRGLGVAVQARAAGDEGRAAQALALTGQDMRAGIQETIRTGPWYPLQPATLAARVKGGGNMEPQPLIDTGQMIASVRSQVEAPGQAPVVVA